MTYQRNETPEPHNVQDTPFPLLRLRETNAGFVCLEMGAIIKGVMQWQRVPVVNTSDEAAS